MLQLASHTGKRIYEGFDGSLMHVTHADDLGIGNRVVDSKLLQGCLVSQNHSCQVHNGFLRIIEASQTEHLQTVDIVETLDNQISRLLSIHSGFVFRDHTAVVVNQWTKKFLASLIHVFQICARVWYHLEVEVDTTYVLCLVHFLDQRLQWRLCFV